MRIAFAIEMLIPEDAGLVSQMIKRIFEDYISPGFSPQGQTEFLSYITPEAIRARTEVEYYGMLVARCTLTGMIIGYLELREDDHISLLFVDPVFHRQGIASHLLQYALKRLSAANCLPDRITVHASVYAVPAYQGMGFRAVGPEQEMNGIVFVPMLKYL